MVFVLLAKDFLDPSQVVLRSAENLAAAVIGGLQEHDLVSIAMEQMPPVSSSFFNVVLRRVLETFGIKGLDRIKITSPSPVLRAVYQRSLEAARRLEVA